MYNLKIRIIPDTFKVLSRSLSIEVKPENMPRKKRTFGMDFTNAKKFEEIPGPLSLPIVGSLWQYYHPFKKYSFERLHETYEKMYREYGPVVREVQSKKRTLVHVFHAIDMERVYGNQGKHPKRISHTALAKYRAERPHLYAGPGLLPSNGEEWLNFRETFFPIIMAAERYESLLEDVVDEMLDVMSHQLDSIGEMDVTPLFYRWGLESIGRALLHRSLNCLSMEKNSEAEILIKAARDTHIASYLSENLYLNTWKYHKMLQKAQDTFTQIIRKHMDEALKTIEKENQGSMFAEMMKTDADPRDIFTMVVDSFLGGIDNSSFALAMTLYNLALNREVQEKLRNDLKELMPKKDVRFTFTPAKERNKNIDYLKSVLLESMRVTPHAPANGRLTGTDLVLSGYYVPKNTLVILQHQVASMMDMHFKDPHKFIPNRHVPLDEFPGYASFPFGVGVRSCIGMNIARLELYIALSRIIRNYEVSYHYDKIGMKTILMNIPDKPVRLRFKKVEE